MLGSKTSFLRTMISSFGFAFEGFSALIKERNFRIHLIAGSMAITLGLYLNISLNEWCILSLTIGLVLMAEAFNSALELICNRITVEVDPRIKKIKDISASAVLFMAIAAAVIGLLIFLPKII